MLSNVNRDFCVQKFLHDLLRAREKVARYGALCPPDTSTLEIMTILLEDRRYFSHKGVDRLSVLRETHKLLRLWQPGGASTIEMQFVRTITGYRERTVWRKIYEAALAMALAARCEKRSVLRAYLALAYFGTKLSGADAAAHQIYGKAAVELTIEEAAFVAAMLCYPRPGAAPPKWREKVERRAAYGLALHRTIWPAIARNYTTLVSRIALADAAR